MTPSPISGLAECGVMAGPVSFSPAVPAVLQLLLQTVVTYPPEAKGDQSTSMQRVYATPAASVKHFCIFSAEMQDVVAQKRGQYEQIHGERDRLSERSAPGAAGDLQRARGATCDAGWVSL